MSWGYDSFMGEKMKNINEKKKTRLVQEFFDLVSIDSPSFGERRMADRLKQILKDMGFSVAEDKAGENYQGTAGNVYGFLKGTLPGEAILLSAHMDTVEPALGKQALLHLDGKITSAGDTVLGADDVAGIVEILEAIRRLRENKIPHRDIEVLFPIAEELYDKGTAVFDFACIKSREAYVMDMSGNIGKAAVKAPTILSFRVIVEGKASHAGFAPEKGINAIQNLARAIGKVPQGHLDEETTLNIGMISGGEATNIVSAMASCSGEIRSYDHERALRAADEVYGIFKEEAEKSGARVRIESQVQVQAYEIPKDASVVKRFQRACKRLSLPECRLVSTFGGSDNNQFVCHGIQGIVLSCGMHEVHSTAEYITVAELEQGVQLVMEILTDPD